jgi:hypothetical protein
MFQRKLEQAMQFNEGKQELVIQYKSKKYFLSACQMEGLPKVYRGYREEIARAQPLF